MPSTISTLKDFARVTVHTKDLDPIYDMAWAIRQVRGLEWAKKFCLYQLMYYYPRAACDAADAPDFWEFVVQNYKEAKRGVERRHFRGKNGMNAIDFLIRKYPDPIAYWDDVYDRNYATMRFNVTRTPSFGDYFAWKAADYMDRVLSMPIDFSASAKFMPEEPAKCADAIWPGINLVDALEIVTRLIDDLPAPGEPNRMCGWSEAETVLCMAKGYFFTKVHDVGFDLEDYYNVMKGHQYAQYVPPMIDKSQYVRGQLALGA